VERAFSAPQEDVLMRPAADADAQAERREPVLGGVVESPAPEAGAAEAQAAEAAEAVEAAVAIAPQETAPAAQPPVAEEDPVPVAPVKLPIDRLIDCAIPLALETPLRGEKILPIIQGLRHVGNKPVHYIGQTENGHWEAVGHGRIYHALQAGIQMANRSSALNELEYSEFITRLRQIADELGAEPDVPDMMEVMKIARSLHQFIVEYGAQLSVNVHANDAPWAIGTLLAALERQGFDLRPDGRLVMPDGEGGTLFSISTNVPLVAETTSKLTLLMDVPCVAAERDGFGAMVACAKSLATRLDGAVVDDGNQPLSNQALEEIAEQVRSFYGDMESMQIAAGSNRALRLFS
jgi:FtsZ-interacting cell division protein ZipA